MPLRFVIAALAIVLAMTAKAQDSAIDDGRQWIDAVPPADAPALLRAASLAARNQDAIAEPLLTAILQKEPASESARGAYQLLSRIYLRRGQYHRAIENLDAWARVFPGDDNVGKERADIEQFRGLPDQISGSPERITSTHGEATDFAAPVRLDGTPANYLLDTGAWISVMTEAEAKRAHLTIRDSHGMLAESSGRGAKIRTAVVKELLVGTRRFRNVSFAILPDVEPWRSMPPGRGGILGIPIVLALECIRWNHGGTWEFGCSGGAASAQPPNMVFFENHLLLASSVGGTRQFLALDTGAETTDLNANFARAFADDVQRNGVKGTTSVAGVGGVAEVASVTLPEVVFEIAGMPTALRAAHVSVQDNPALGGRCCVGNIGLDVLLQKGTLTIDFASMTLRLR